MIGFDDQTPNLAEKETLHFTAKNVYSTKNNPMCGICLHRWIQILYNHGKHVEIQYIPRVVFITLLSFVNSLLSLVEGCLYGEAIKRQVLPDNPVFVIGHPRTGTTLIHNLLASDQSSFFYCTTYCAGFPSSFLWSESWGIHSIF